MQPLHEDLEDKEFEKPDGVEKQYVKGVGRSELIVDGTEPHFTNKIVRRVSKPKTRVKTKTKSENNKKGNDDDDNKKEKSSSKDKDDD